jgi:spore coat protein CotH
LYSADVNDAASTKAPLDRLFDDSVVHEVRLEIHPNDWRKLRDNYLDNTYYAANFGWGSTFFENVGIRSRGNGSRNQAKPGLRIDFNRYLDGQKFLGLKSLVLDNLAQDQTMMAERISMAMFRRMRIPAPRVVHARLYVNESYVGLYTMVEPIDKGFLARNLGEDSGYLYDYEWSREYWFEYAGDDAARYTPYPFEPQTHESDPDPVPLIAMIRAINQSSDEQFLEKVSPYLDLEQFVRYLAVEAYLGENDGVLGQWGTNNFYLYRSKETGRSSLIAWDKDVTLRDHERSIWTNTDRHVLARRALAVPELRAHYLATMEQCLESGSGWLESEIEKQRVQILTAVVADPSKPFTYSEFEEGIWILNNFAWERPRRLVAEIAAARAQ